MAFEVKLRELLRRHLCLELVVSGAHQFVPPPCVLLSFVLMSPFICVDSDTLQSSNGNGDDGDGGDSGGGGGGLDTFRQFS